MNLPQVDMFDQDEEGFYVYEAAKPETKYRVDPLLDAFGNETKDPEKAMGGVVCFNPNCFGVFTFPPTVH